MPQEDICPKCKQPRQGGESGSLTDWISKCRCGLLSEEEELFLSLKFCQVCQKRISDARHGSLTQWIFRVDLCSCEKPVPAEHTPEDNAEQEHSALAQPAWETPDLPELESIDVDFPIDQFKPVEEIGRGSTGVVFRCQDRRLDNIVAIKVLQNFDSRQIVSFQKEAKITALLKHDNIIQIRDIGVANESTPYMVLQYVTGLTLDKYIEQNGPMDWTTVVNLTKQICSAIEYAHEQDVFHRDITPRNILLTKDEDGELLVKVIDFGLAAFQRSEDQRNEFQGHTLAGTPGYLCPDQAAGLSYDASCDIYSIGCVVYESLTGEPLFTGSTALEMLNSQMNASTDTAIESLAVPEVVQTVLKRCLASDRNDRYRSAAELMEDLKLCLHSQVEEEADEEIEEEVDEKTTKSNISPRLTKVVVASLFVVSLGLFGTVAWLLIFDSHSSSSDKQDAVEAPISGWPPGEVGRFTEVSPGIFKSFALSDDEALKLLQEKENVQALDLSGSMINGSGFKYLTRLPIEDLNLHSTPITNDSISELFNFKSLKALYLTSTSATGENFEKFQHLRHLDMRKTKLNDAGAESISRIKTLKDLTVTGEFLTRRGIESIATAKKLSRFAVYTDALSSKDLEPIKQMKKLSSLKFQDRTLSKEDILFAQSDTVKYFNCDESRLKSPEVADYFTQLKNLKNLDLGIPGISSAQLTKIAASLPDCTVRDVSSFVRLQEKKTKEIKSGVDSLVIDVGIPDEKK